VARRTQGITCGEDGVSRCQWCTSDPVYQRYHDDEWGVPIVDDRRLFEKLCLEGFQSGLSWLTILKKRENFRRAFAGFNIQKVARFTEADVKRLLEDQGIIRHRGKIESVINNAQRAIELIGAEGSLSALVWRYEPNPADRPKRVTWDVVKAMSETAESNALSKELKKRGWSFVGPTTVYAFMQAMGLVNDHVEGCECRKAIEDARAAFQRPA